MSDARTDFFASGAKASKPPPSRDDFFAGKVPLDDEAAAPGVTSIYDRIGQSLRNAPGAIASGFNRGVASTVGLLGDTAQNVIDIGGAAYSATRSALTGEDPNDLYQVPDRSKLPLTGDWFAQQLDSTPLGPVTQLPTPEDPAARILYAGAAGVPGGLVGGGGAAPALAGAVGGGAGAVASELGLDPAAQAAISMVAGAGVGALPQRTREFTPAAKPTDPLSETQAKLNAAASKQSMGAAGAAVDLQKLSPDLRVAVTKAVNETGGAVNPEAMARHIQADSLPVKVHLSEGQVLGDPRLISEERNARGATPGYVEGFAAQNKALTANLRTFRDTAGENVFSTSPDQHADTIIARYKAIDEARNADIGAKYQALRDAAGGEFPVDTQTLLTNVRGALKKELASSKAPADVMAQLEEKAASGSMTLEDFEAMRSSLARTQRSSPDGQERHAAGVIRNQIEAMPLQAGAEQLKGLADAARNAARERFQALEADPAYKAAVNETTPPDRFVQKFVIGGARDNVAKLSQAMKGDETATQTLKVATLDHLRQAAGIDGSFNGNFTQHGYNKALRALEPKLGSLLDADLAEHVQNLGDVARYSQLQPEGHYVNNSNTSVAQRALAHGADVLEGAANVKAGGIPVGTWVRQNVTDRAGRKAAAKTFAPGAGLTKLSDLAKVGKDKK